MCASVPVSALVLVLLVHLNLFTVGSSTVDTHPLYQRIRRQTPCNKLEYACANGDCIASYRVCDGTKDCSDGSDETIGACREVRIICPALAFECSYGACIDRELRCDNKTDCADGSDELKCGEPDPTHSCPSGNYRCSNGQCINQYTMCDGSKNCSDGSDETYSLCKDFNCPVNSFQCAYGACLDKSMKCNNKQDCADGSDELNLDCPPSPIDKDTSPPGNDGCQLPSHPQNGAYISVHCSPGDARTMCLNIPGTPVPDKWVLEYRCYANYELSNHNEFSVCDGGIWKNPLKCIKLCSPLVSISMDIECVYNGQKVTCANQMKPNTTATANCKQHYKEIYHRQYTNLVCLNTGEWSYPLFHCEPDCGISTKIEGTNTNVVDPLILNGNKTNYGDFPWLAALYFKNEDNWDLNCGGTLITPHIVLTAAHCLVSDLGIKVAPENIKVGLGKYFRDYNIRENFSMILDVQDIVVPRYYSGKPSFFALDIGLIDLKKSIQVTGYIMPACVDWPASITVSPGAKGYVAGWGAMENGLTSDEILSTQLTYVDNVDCLRRAQQKFKGLIKHDKFCAGILTPNGGQVDRGDSGGGLTYVWKGQHYVIGIVSSKSTRDTEFSLFTDLSNVQHRNWLEVHKTNLDRLHNES